MVQAPVGVYLLPTVNKLASAKGRKGETMAFDFQKTPKSGAMNVVVRLILLPVALCLWLACPASAQDGGALPAAGSAVTAQAQSAVQKEKPVVAVAAADASVQAAPTVATPPVSHAAEVDAVDNHPWWFWPVALLFFCFLLGIVAVMAGVGGGVLFVPLVSGFFPFHLDFVRGAGLLVALAGALAAGPGLLRRNFANLRLALPVALIASACAIVGAMLGLALPTNIIQTCLGATILGIAVLLLLSKNSVRPVVTTQDAVGLALGMNGVFLEPSTGEVVQWKTHRTLAGLLLFIAIGIMAGMFGLGAGWANVPVLNLLMGAPLKVAVGTSKFLLSITDTSAAWVYLNQGCVIPLMAVPSIVGLMLGSVVGVRLLAKAKPKFIRYMVILVLFFAGAKALMKGLGW